MCCTLSCKLARSALAAANSAYWLLFGLRGRCQGTAIVHDRPSLLMEYIPQTLDRYLRDIYVGEPELQLLAFQGATALKYLHAKGIVHR